MSMKWDSCESIRLARWSSATPAEARSSIALTTGKGPRVFDLAEGRLLDARDSVIG